jgi:hypothetical protein
MFGIKYIHIKYNILQFKRNTVQTRCVEGVGTVHFNSIYPKFYTSESAPTARISYLYVSNAD